MFVDTHAHITSDELFPEIEEIIEQAKKSHLSRILNICTDQSTLQRGIQVGQKHPIVWNAGATTPHDVGKLGISDFPLFEKAAREGKLVAIGETGLDYHYTHSPKALQQEYLKRYFALAEETNLPVIIHCREAFYDLFSFADRFYRGNRPILLHCFTGTKEEAEECVKRGWYVSMSGIVTFNKSTDLQETLKTIPLNQLVVETDAPYLAPGKYRGKMNKPHYILETYYFISAHLGIDLYKLSEQVAINFSHFLGKKE